MTPFTEQAKHNENFHACICTEFSEQFFDWKITCVFYSAYHLVKSLADIKSIHIGDRHTDIMWNMNPRNRKRLMQVKTAFYDAYDELFEYSRTARYDGFTDFETFQKMKKADHNHAQYLYDYIRKYVVGQGVAL